MHLVPRELEKIMLHYAGQLAKERLERGLQLNYPEAIALISAELVERARDGMSVAELMNYGRKILGAEQVMDGVAEMIHEIQIEATFPDGTKLVTVHDPIPCTGKFIPGELIPEEGNIVLNEGKDTVGLVVVNTADRPIQVGSHYHFYEVNKLLEFDRKLAYGYRLDIPSGTAVRFEPGESKKVTLTLVGGTREGYGLNNLVKGYMDDEEIKRESLVKAQELGFKGV